MNRTIPMNWRTARRKWQGSMDWRGRHVSCFVAILAALGAVLWASYAIGASLPKVAPLGFEIGVADFSSVSRSLPRESSPSEPGINRYSDGPMIRTGGDGYGVDGLQSVLFIFDRKNILCGVVMTLSKARFDEVYGHLAGKYRLEKKQVPFVGDRYARFRTGKVVVELSAPHLSFEMEARYLTDELVRLFQQISRQEEEEKTRSERKRF